MRILIVDDSKLIRILLKDILQMEIKGNIDEASNGEEAITKLHNNSYDLIILDVFLPDILGIEIIDQIAALKKEWIPIIVITSAENKEFLKEALEKGAIDYIKKPFDEIEILARVKSALRTKRLYDELKEANEKLKEMAMTDELTKLYNRRYTMIILGTEFKRSKRYKNPLSVIIGDIDHFKSINDNYGHLIGDEVLRICAKLIKENTREIDVAGRYGGEEFLIILPNTTLDGAVIVAERLRRKIKEIPFKVLDKNFPIHISMSFGICSYPEKDIENEEDMLKLADEALYISKQNGRNQTTFYINGRFISLPQEVIKSEA
ncbi:MAG: diguanylate cyclase [Synergistetes bacterium]|nr:diguanylate cyclase [Synergistota bacterium]MDW8192137.1 diguanylate cyclase [Synergistota bacterium]